MSFQPVVTLTNVPRDNSAFTLTDATPTGGSSGWGSTNAPANPAAIISLFGQVQPYGSSPVNAGAVTGSVSTTMTFAEAISDGVNTYVAYYGLSQSIVAGYTVSSDGLTITVTDPNIANYLDGVKAISLDGASFPCIIASRSGGVITLVTPVTANATGSAFFKYYIATIQALTLNQGEAICVNGISLLPLEVDACTNADAIFNNIALKLAAETAYNCGNISKAHEAAIILSGGKPVTTSNCPSCG